MKKQKYDLSKIMKRAWLLLRKSNNQKPWSLCLKESWFIEKNGIGISFEEIYKKYNLVILYYICGKVNNDQFLAEELCNDVFLQVNKHLDTYDVHVAKINTWIHHIAKNKIVDFYRSKYKRNQHNTDYVDAYVDESGNTTYEYSSHDLNGEERLENKELGKTIYKAFDSLKPKYREIGNMFFIEQLSYEEISDMLEIPIGTVKGTINRCRTMLQEKLQGVY